MAILEMKSVDKGYGSGATRTEVLSGVDLTIEEGEFVAIVGFSGSGKSTLLALLAGLILPDRGSILLDGQEIRGAGPDRGVVFQNYSLLPWLSVRENVALAVNQVFSAWPRARRGAQVERFIDLVGLGPAMDKKPHELSGGMRQRVSVARALAMSPRMLLMDEPLGALDALTRATLQAEIERIWRRDQKTAVLITNDVDEGILLADRIIPLKPGPRATLGPSFPVSLDRPRDRASLNADPEFRRLRNELLGYLSRCRDEGRAARAARGGNRMRRRPALEPADLRGL
jgi:nitrate/nitrite transport system ATP-binding protein